MKTSKIKCLTGDTTLAEAIYYLLYAKWYDNLKSLKGALKFRKRLVRDSIPTLGGWINHKKSPEEASISSGKSNLSKTSYVADCLVQFVFEKCHNSFCSVYVLSSKLLWSYHSSILERVPQKRSNTDVIIHRHTSVEMTEMYRLSVEVAYRLGCCACHPSYIT